MSPSGQSHFFKTKSGVRTHYIQYGNLSGPPIILLHGLGGSTSTFDPLLPSLLSDSHNVIAVDFEGFGETALASSKFSVQGHVDNLDELIKSLSPSRPPVIIGHSLGSIVALHYAARGANNVKGLCLIGVGRSASHIPAARQRMLGLAGKVRTEGIASAAEFATTTNFAANEEASPLQREAVRQAVAASDPEAYALTCEAMVDPGHKDPDYSSIVCPTVFIYGDGDVISPPERSVELMNLLSSPKKCVWEVSGGHQPILSDLGKTKEGVAKLFEFVDSQ